jgi:cytochrome c553
MQHLQVHHLKFRSQSGGDEEQNLITLCAECHGLCCDGRAASKFFGRA